MERQEYEELIRRLVVVSEQQGNTQAGITTTLGKMEERQADMHSLLGSLNTTLEQQQTLLAEQKTLLAYQTTLFDRIVLVLERHEETFERLWRLLDERLPPAQGHGRTEG